MPLGRVLIVDDEPQVAAMLRDVLTSLDYETALAPNGLDALRLVPLVRPDVVLLDLEMPGLSGGEVLDALRRDHPDIPVVMVTANQDFHIARETLARGALDYVLKPFEIDVLERILATALVYRSRAAGAAGGGAPPPPRPAPAIRGTVLYIEDNDSSRRLVEMLLEERPEIRLLLAIDARQGLALARDRQPDLILLDIHLPDMEGPDVLRELREDPALRHTPVIVLSAEADVDLPDRMRAAGAQGYLAKPLNFQQFFAMVDAHVATGGG